MPDSGPPPACEPPQPGDLVLNEVLIDGTVPRTEDDEFVELVNVADRPVSLAGLKISSNAGGGRSDRVVFTAGCIPSLGAVAMYEDAADWIWIPQPDGARFETGSFGFANGSDFDFRLEPVAGGDVLSAMAGASSLIEEGISINRDPDLVGNTFRRHDQLPSLLNTSPALCSNGNTFLSRCEEAPPP